MSTEVAATPGAVEQPKDTETVAAPAADVQAPTAAEPAADAASPSKEDPVKHRSRSPFSDLKNKFFHSKEKKAVEPETTEATPATENVAPAAETVEPASEEAAAKVDDKKEKKAGMFDKVKSLFEPKPKKAVKDDKAEESTGEEAVADFTPAAAEPAAAPAEPATETVAPTTEAEAPVTESAPVEPKAEEKPASLKKEKDLLKLGRRLSARVGQAFSPKREKKDPLAGSPDATPVTEEPPKLETTIDDSKVAGPESTTDAAAKPSEEVKAAVETPYPEPTIEPAVTTSTTEAEVKA